MGLTDWEIEVRDTSDALVDLLAADTSSVSWRYDAIGGCGDCTIKLNRSFDNYGSLALDYDVRIIRRLAAGDETRWSGFIRQITPALEEPESVTLNCSGYVRQMEYQIVEYTYNSIDMGAAARHLIDTWLVPYTRIQRTSGLNLCADTAISSSATGLTFRSNAYDVMRNLAEIGGNAEWGIRADKEIYFKPRSTSVKQTWIIGDRVSFYQLATTSDDLVHTVLLQGAGGLPFQLNGDPPANAHYTKKRLATMAAISTWDDANLWGNAYFAKYNPAQPRGTLKLSATDAWIENVTGQSMPPIGRLRVQGGPIYTPQGTIGTATDTQFRVDSVQYTPTENGLDITIDLGEKRGALTDLLRGIEQKISDVRQGANQLSNNAVGTIQIQNSAVSGQVIKDSTVEMTPSSVTEQVIDGLTMNVQGTVGSSAVSIAATVEIECQSDTDPSSYWLDLRDGVAVYGILIAARFFEFPVGRFVTTQSIHGVINPDPMGNHDFNLTIKRVGGANIANKARNAYIVAVNYKK